MVEGQGRTVSGLKPEANLVIFLSIIPILSVNYWSWGEVAGRQCIDVRSFHLICYTFLFDIIRILEIGWFPAQVLQVIVKDSVFFQLAEQFFFPVI